MSYGKTGAACQQECEYTKTDNETFYINQCIVQLEHLLECVEEISEKFLKDKIENTISYKGKKYYHRDLFQSTSFNLSKIKKLITEKIEIVKDI